MVLSSILFKIFWTWFILIISTAIAGLINTGGDGGRSGFTDKYSWQQVDKVLKLIMLVLFVSAIPCSLIAIWFLV